MKNTSLHLLKLTGAIALFSLPTAIFANIIIDADVPATMNTSGNQYIVGSAGPFERDLGSTTVTVGNSNPDVSLVIQNGGVLSNGIGRIGNGAGSNGNSVTVTGPGSTWNNSGTFSMGVSGGGNSLAVLNGGSFQGGSGFYIGSSTSSQNEVTISGSNSTLSVNEIQMTSSNNHFSITNGGNVTVTNATRILGEENTVSIQGSNSTYMANSFRLAGNHNQLEINTGATLHATSNVFIGYNSPYSENHAVVEGFNSRIIATNNLTFGGINNTLTIRSSALVVSNTNIAFDDFGGNNGNFLRIDGGYLAWQGNQTEGITNFLDLEFIQVWNGEEWVIATSETLIYSFFADDASALAFSGYDDLGGYTIVTAVAVPEPSLFAMLLGSIAGGFICIRRIRRCTGK